MFLVTSVAICLDFKDKDKNRNVELIDRLKLKTINRC